jgi:gamma-glutamyltranspeptidase
MSSPTHAITTRPLSINYRNGEIVLTGEPKGSPVPAGTVFAINERFAAEYKDNADFVFIDAATAAELVAEQEKQAAAYAAEVARLTAQRDAAEKAEQERQERAAALVSLALSAVPKAGRAGR